MDNLYCVSGRAGPKFFHTTGGLGRAGPKIKIWRAGPGRNFLDPPTISSINDANVQNILNIISCLILLPTNVGKEYNELDLYDVWDC